MSDVVISILDNLNAGSVVVPQPQVQHVLGTCSGGTVGIPYVASGLSGPATLIAAAGYGPGIEAAAMACVAGATVVFWKLFTVNKGTCSAVTPGAGNTGATVMTVTVDGTQGSFDDGLFLVKCTTAGTIGTSASIQVSGDAGRTFGPVIALGSAVTYAISNMGITLHFTVATIAVGDTYTFGSYAPSSATTNGGGGVNEVLNFIKASPYALVGWGSLHIVGGPDGTQCMQGWTYAHMHTIEGYLDGLATANVPTGAIMSLRDASPAAKWGGTGETEATWDAALAGDVAGASDVRALASGGYYNMPSAIFNASIGGWVPRRSGAWALAVRQTKIELKTLASRASDNPLSNIVVDSTNDPADGFIYHDERTVPALGAAKICAYRTRFGYKGFFCDEPYMLAPFGSTFDLWPKRAVMDAAQRIAMQSGVLLLNIDTRLNADGTIFANDANAAELGIKGALDTGLTSTRQISSCQVQLDRTVNILTVKKFKFTVTIVSRGYILEVDLTLAYGPATS